MLGTLLLVCAVGGALAGYSDSSSGNTVGGGSFSTGSGYGFSGSYSGGAPPANFPALPGFNFPGFLNTYLDSFQKYHQQFINTPGGGFRPYSYSFSSSSPNSNSQAMTSMSYNGAGLQDNFNRAQSGSFVPGGFPGSTGPGLNSYGSPVNTAGGFGNGAAASASIGPGGVHQTASIFPENPAFPNVNTRFGANGGRPGSNFQSVFTSSSSHTSNVNGQPQTYQTAQTTVNDNGKITTYESHSP